MTVATEMPSLYLRPELIMSTGTLCGARGARRAIEGRCWFRPIVSWLLAFRVASSAARIACVRSFASLLRLSTAAAFRTCSCASWASQASFATRSVSSFWSLAFFRAFLAALDSLLLDPSSFYFPSFVPTPYLLPFSSRRQCCYSHFAAHLAAFGVWPSSHATRFLWCSYCTLHFV